MNPKLPKQKGSWTNHETQNLKTHEMSLLRAQDYLSIMNFVFVQNLVAKLLIHMRQLQGTVKGDSSRFFPFEVDLWKTNTIDNNYR
jgi:hypothetical protein